MHGFGLLIWWLACDLVLPLGRVEEGWTESVVRERYELAEMLRGGDDELLARVWERLREELGDEGA